MFIEHIHKVETMNKPKKLPTSILLIHSYKLRELSQNHQPTNFFFMPSRKKREEHKKRKVSRT